MEQLMVCIPLIRLYRLHSGVTVLILFENAWFWREHFGFKLYPIKPMRIFRMFKQLKEKLWFRLNVIYLAAVNLLFLMQKSVNPEDIPDLSGQSVLIVGTGPSADRLSTELVDRYDALVLINYAFLIPLLHSLDTTKYKLFFYSGDVDRLEQVSNRLSMRPDIPVIFAPYQITNCRYSRLINAFKRIYFVKVRKSDILSIFGLITNIAIKGFGGWCFPDWPQPLVGQVNSYVRNDSSACLPIAGGTSALSAILMLSKCGFSQIDLIGCDFNSGRSTSLASALGKADFHFSDLKDRFNMISNLLHSFHIKVRNLSWI
jgi:hypothetical protein